MRTADEILDNELNIEMLTYLKENPIFREWIKDAMYLFAIEFHTHETLKLNKQLIEPEQHTVVGC